MIDSSRPQTNSEMAIGYNIYADKLLMPEQRMEHEAAIDLAYIKEHSQEWPTYLEDKIENNDVTLVGEAHTPLAIEKRAVAAVLGVARERGLTDVGLEIDESHQPYIDSFMRTGKFVDTDDPGEYDQADKMLELQLAFTADQSVQNYNAMQEFEAAHKHNFLFSSGGAMLQGQFDMLRSCREQGLAVHCLDRKIPPPSDDVEDIEEYRAREEARRDEEMYAKGKNIVKNGDRKLLVVVGAAHVATGAREHTNAGDLFAADQTVRSARLFMERDTEHDPHMTGFAKQHSIDGENLALNSALYSGLKGAGINNVGFDLTPDILTPDGPNLAAPPPFDGYIAL